MKRILFLLLAAIFLTGSVAFVLSLEDIAEVQTDQEPVPLAIVRYQKFQAQTHSGMVSIFAEVTPRWQVTLKANVSGKVAEVFPAALVGEDVEVGTPLVRIESSAYAADLSAAAHTLAQAILERDKANQRTELARSQWKRAHPNEAPTDLILHLPDLTVAILAVTAAQAKVDAAQVNYNATNIGAPFPGVITERWINIGQTISVGDPLVNVVHDNILDVFLSLTPLDLRLLRPDWANSTIPILNQNGAEITKATVRQGKAFLDLKTRQYRVFLQIQKQNARGIQAGEFVTAELPTRDIENSLRIPAGSLTRDGYIWYIDAGNRLQRFQALPVFRQDSDIIVLTPDGTASVGIWNVVLTPLASFIPGMTVSAQKVEPAQ